MLRCCLALRCFPLLLSLARHISGMQQPPCVRPDSSRASVQTTLAVPHDVCHAVPAVVAVQVPAAVRGVAVPVKLPDAAFGSGFELLLYLRTWGTLLYCI
jgi:hypothetical protein